MLSARGIRACNPIVSATGGTRTRSLVHHVFHRRYTEYTLIKANFTTVKLLETEIRELNADDSLSAIEKYRNSFRLFAMLDHCKAAIETQATLRKLNGIITAMKDPATIR